MRRYFIANKKNNKLFIETEKKSIDSTLKLFERNKNEKVTVALICQTAEINRSTFYAHFIDIYDLYDSIDHYLREDLVTFYKRNKIMEEGVKPFSKKSLQLFLTYIYEHRSFYKNIYVGNKLFSMEQYRVYFNKVFSELKSSDFNISKIEMEYFLTGFQGSLTSIIKKWLDGDCAEPTEVISEIIIECLPTKWNKLSEKFYC